VEGIYQNVGDVCPLDIVVEYAKSYKYRLILDDSLGFGVLGPTGKGTPEHFGISTATVKGNEKRRVVNTIELICANMEASLGTVGGFCVGSNEVIDHQRLHGLGYCFSASAPPYTCTTGLVSLTFIKKELASKVRSHAALLRKALATIPGIVVVGHEKEINSQSPVIFLRINHSSSLHSSTSTFDNPSNDITSDWRQKDESILKSVAEELLENDIIVYQPHYVATEREQPWPSLRIFVTASHTPDQFKQLVNQLSKSFAHHFVSSSLSISSSFTSSSSSSLSNSITSSSVASTTSKKSNNKKKKRGTNNEEKKRNT